MLEPRSYKVYFLLLEPAADMKSHLQNWIAIYEEAIDRKLESTDYIFPKIDKKGRINPKEPMLQSTFKIWLNE